MPNEPIHPHHCCCQHCCPSGPGDHIRRMDRKILILAAIGIAALTVLLFSL